MIFALFVGEDSSWRRRRRRRRRVAQDSPGLDGIERSPASSQVEDKDDNDGDKTPVTPSTARPWLRRTLTWTDKNFDDRTLSRTNTELSSLSAEPGAFKPRTRWLPILSGVLSPFSILLEISGLTAHWYIATAEAGARGAIIDSQPNPPWLITCLAFSLVAAVVANIALIGRFLEWRCWWTTVIACTALTVHDCLNLPVVIYFGVIHAIDDGYTYGSPWYLTVASTACSCICNVTLIVDFFRIKDFAKHGSGLTSKQRELVIAVMALLCYLALGSICNAELIDISFEQALYFSIVTIATVGFGDIVPVSDGAKIFAFFYDSVGIVCVAFTIKVARETLIESFEKAYRYRRHLIAERARERRTLRRAQLAARREALARGENIHDATALAAVVGGGRGGASGATAGTSLGPTLREAAGHGVSSGRRLLDRLRVRCGFSSYETTRRAKYEDKINEKREEQNGETAMTGEAQYRKFKQELEHEERREARLKIGVALTLFFSFWLLGAMIFHFTEGWTFFQGLWFSYIYFSTIGYGDLSPATPAGRAVFIAWSLFGICVMTVLFSVLGEVWSSTYSNSMQAGRRRRAARFLPPGSDATAPSGLANFTGPTAGTTIHDPSVGGAAASEDIGQALVKAAKDFTANARYFMNGREGDVPARLHGLLALAEDEEALHKLQTEVEHSEARTDTRHFLAMISYERSLEGLIEAGEKASHILAAREVELAELRKLNASLREAIAVSGPPPTSARVPASGSRPSLRVDTTAGKTDIERGHHAPAVVTADDISEDMADDDDDAIDDELEAEEEEDEERRRAQEVLRKATAVLDTAEASEQPLTTASPPRARLTRTPTTGVTFAE